MTTLTEAEVEQAALEWLSSLGWQAAHGPDIARTLPTPSAPTTARWSWSGG